MLDSLDSLYPGGDPNFDVTANPVAGMMASVAQIIDPRTGVLLDIIREHGFPHS